MNQRFYRRSAVCFALIAVMLLVCTVRVGILTSDESLKNTALSETSYRLSLYKVRGTLYDTSMRPLTDTAYIRRCVLAPDNVGLAAAGRLLAGQALDLATERLLAGYPVTAPLGASDLPYGAIEYFEPVRLPTACACHIIGYLDSDGHGVSGLEKELDAILYTGESVTADFALTATGKILPSVEGNISEKSAASYVKLTIDRDVQLVTEKAMRDVERGAAVVIEAETGKVRAIVSKPAFDTDISALDLTNADAPLLDRALSNYNVGSVFKLCVAAAALDSGFDTHRIFECNSSFDSGSRIFHCHDGECHGQLDMCDAIAESCNVWFYNLVCELGAEPILNTARLCGFEESTILFRGLESARGTMPELPELCSRSALCNFAIGQGSIMLSPLVISNLYCAIASGGSYREPYIIEEISSPVRRTYTSDRVTRVMSEDTANTLKEYLRYAVSHGTGRNAAPSSEVVSGGKTATAQTGRFIGGERVSDGWYCGFTALNGKNYVICIVRENVRSGASDCAPVFADVADGIAEIYNN